MCSSLAFAHVALASYPTSVGRDSASQATAQLAKHDSFRPCSEGQLELGPGCWNFQCHPYRLFSQDIRVGQKAPTDHSFGVKQNQVASSSALGGGVPGGSCPQGASTVSSLGL